MSNIEEKFFEAFGIEPLNYQYCDENIHNIESVKCSVCKRCDGVKVYPTITTDMLLQLIQSLTINCYKVEIFNILTNQGVNEYVVNLTREPNRFHSHDKELKIALLNAIKLLSDDEDIKIEICSLFEEVE